MKAMSFGFALLLAGSFAQGADAATSGWAGPYVGFNVGGNSLQSHATTTAAFSPTGYFALTSPPAIATSGNQNFQRANVIVGGQIGYNWLTDDDWLFGAEADFDSNGGAGFRKATGIYPCCAPSAFTVVSRASSS